jgi:hypothetical protein
MQHIGTEVINGEPHVFYQLDDEDIAAIKEHADEPWIEYFEPDPDPDTDLN